ncbi:MAG TPA: lipocalin family protein [Caulobacteraceae bacterium]|nr:lipocalin family protein [Caulobacteraceae bacterium]
MTIVSATWASLPPQPAKALDTNRFVGRWYEVARMPNKIQADCATSLADWSHDGGSAFKVIQTCHVDTPTGPTKVWRAAGHILDPATNAKFRMSFFGGLISQDYWVLDRGDDYSWIILSTPSPKFLWIFARRPATSPELKAAMVGRAKAMGYDVASLVYDQPGT